MRRTPVLPTLIVALAALLMVRLGFWQLHRLHVKDALLAQYQANAARPQASLAALFPVRDKDLYRRTGAFCLNVAHWTMQAGRSADGSAGWRHIATCRTGAEGPGFAVDMGVSSNTAKPGWSGGPVSGRLIWLTERQSLPDMLMRRTGPHTPLIVSDRPAPGLRPAVQPNPADLPNNHLSYAVQWFLFAAVAVAIYGIALWQRARKIAAGPPR